MSFRYDMRNKPTTAQAIVRQRDRDDELRKSEYEKKKAKNQTRVMIKETDYLILWKQVTLDMDNEDVAAIELITVKELNRDEVRFAYYKRLEDGTLRFVPSPLDLEPSKLEILLKKARDEGIIK